MLKKWMNGALGLEMSEAGSENGDIWGISHYLYGIHKEILKC